LGIFAGARGERAAKQYVVEEGEGVGGEKSVGRRGEGIGRRPPPWHNGMVRIGETRDAI
jgi:hypothetical protein